MTLRYLSQIIHDQTPLVLSASETVQHACKCMQERRVGAVLVEKNEQLVGIFTGRDAVCRVIAAGHDPRRTKLASVMTANPDTIPPGKSAIDALRLMKDGGYRHLPVVQEGKIRGIVSRGDFRGIELDRLDEETGLWERI
jgi:CBS domain-containing protein